MKNSLPTSLIHHRTLARSFTHIFLMRERKKILAQKGFAYETVLIKISAMLMNGHIQAHK